MKTLQRPLLFFGHTVYLLPIVSVLVVFSRQIWDFARFTYDEAEDLATDYEHWKPRKAALPLFSFLIAFTWAICILAYPPRTPLRRKLSIVALAVPLWSAFKNTQYIWPEFTICDTLNRFCYIWFAHMSHEVTILEFTPAVDKENDCLKIRLREAYKVLFNRNRRQVEQQSHARPQTLKHGYTHKEFLLRHVWKITYMFTLSCAYPYLMHKYVPEFEPDYHLHYSSFHRRLPESLSAEEMWHRFDIAFEWSITTWWLYDQYHSFIAILFVNILRLDNPDDWSMSLFGSVSDAWSVRRYWGKFWHNFVYHSFSAHAKIVTRQWLGMQRGQMSTRLTENTLVFLMSGLGHTLVSWLYLGSEESDGKIWCITVWYVAQMLPIIVECVVQKMVLVETRRYLDARYPKLMMYAERTVGYAWVCWWMMWSVPKYTYMKSDWSFQMMSERLRLESANNTIVGGHDGLL
jgi:hypothetical protein